LYGLAKLDFRDTRPVGWDAVSAARFAATVEEVERAIVAGTAQRPLATFASILAKPK
jgi:hypothetical protein